MMTRNGLFVGQGTGGRVPGHIPETIGISGQTVETAAFHIPQVWRIVLNRHEVYPRMAVTACNLTHPLQCGFTSLPATMCIRELDWHVNENYRFTSHPEVTGMPEVAFAQRDHELPQGLVIEADWFELSAVPLVAPVHTELHLVDETALQESLFKCIIQVTEALVEVPVKDKVADPMLHRPVDMPVRHLRQGFVVVTQTRFEIVDFAHPPTAPVPIQHDREVVTPQLDVHGR